jgi:hypothetical protein
MAKMIYGNRVLDTQGIVSQLDANPTLDLYVGPKGFINREDRTISNTRVRRNGETFEL